MAKEGALALDVAEAGAREASQAVHVKVVRRGAARRRVDLRGALGVEVFAADGAGDLRQAPLALQAFLHVLQKMQTRINCKWPGHQSLNIQ